MKVKNDFTMRKFFSIIIGLIGILLAAGVVLSCYSSLYEPLEESYIPFAGFGFPYLWFASAVYAIVVLILGSKIKAILPLVVIVITWRSFMSVCNIGFGSAPVDNQNNIKFLTYNVRNFNYGKYLENVSLDDFISFFDERDADIICLQEVPMSKILERLGFDDYKNAFATYKYIINDEYVGKAHPYASAQMILSKYPIEHVSVEEFSKETSTSVLVVDADINGIKTRIFNCHLKSIRLSDKQLTAVNNVQHADIGDETKENIKTTYHQMANAFVARAVQARELKQAIANSPVKTIVCGDFNDTPISFTYRQISQNMNDSFVESGRGWANTYNGKLPPLRIDYVLYSEGIASESHEILDNVVLSDHFPIATSFSFTN